MIPPLGERLVASALELSARPSAEARAAAARTLFDFCGCVLGAGPASSGWADAAGRLAASAHLRDLDDLHHASATHPGGIVWSAVAVCGLTGGVTWGEAVEAATLGYELVGRIGGSLTADHRRYWHATAVAGVVGAAAAAAKLLGGARSTIVDAVGHASSIASGSAQAQVERTGTRLVHRAYAACAGVMCARAACGGLAAIEHGLDGGRGVFSIGLTTEEVEAAAGRQEAFTLQRTGFRLHPATGFSHAAVDAALELGPIDPGEINGIAVRVSPPAALALASDPEPASDDDAWWSIEHAVAVCLATGGTDALQSGLTRDAELLRLCARVEVSASGPGWGAEIEVSTRDGRTLRASCDVPLGHPVRPATDDDLCGKWTRLTGEDGAAYLSRLSAARPGDEFALLLDPRIAARAGSGRMRGAAPDRREQAPQVPSHHGRSLGRRPG